MAEVEDSKVQEQPANAAPSSDAIPGAEPQLRPTPFSSRSDKGITSIFVGLALVLTVGVVLMLALAPPPEVSHINLNADRVKRDNQLGLEAFVASTRQTLQAGTTGRRNTLVSPLLTAQALGVLLNGSTPGSATHQALAEVIAPGSDIEAFNQHYRDANELFPFMDSKSVHAYFGGAMWCNSGLDIRKVFRERAKLNYGIHFHTGEFTDLALWEYMNNWSSKTSRNFVPYVISEVDGFDSSLLSFITNVFFFHGAWTNPPDASQSRRDTFKVPGAEPTECVYMHFEAGSFHYGTYANGRMARLPFGTQRCALYLLLPDNDLESTLNAITPEGLENAFTTLSPAQRWDLWMPRLRRNECDLSLRPWLETLPGGKAWFDAAANWDEIFRGEDPELAFPGDVRQVNAITLVESASAEETLTPLQEVPQMALQGSPTTMVANRPFLFFARDDKSGQILLAGCILDPTWQPAPKGRESIPGARNAKTPLG